MLRFVDRLEGMDFDGGFSMESGRGSGACGRFGLPHGYGVPVFLLFPVKFVFPFLLRLFAVSANVAALVAARALTAFDVVVELTLCLRGNLLAFHNCIEVGPFEAGRKLVGLFMGGTSGEMGFGWVIRSVSFLPVLVRVGFVATGCGVVAGVFGLIPFFFGVLGSAGSMMSVTGVLTPRKWGGLEQSSMDRLIRSSVNLARPLPSFADRSSPMEGQSKTVVFWADI